MTTPGTIASTLLLLALPITLSYVASCLFWPFRACRRCDGYGQLRGWLGGIRPCPACQGTGLRLRFGRRVINTFRHLYREINDRRER